MAPLFLAREIPRIVPSLPPVKRLAADAEVATGQRRILSMPPVMVQPLQSCFCQPADPLTLPITEPGLLALTIFMMTLF